MSRHRTTLFAALRRRPTIVVVSALSAGLVGAGVGLSLPVSYAATAHVVVSRPDWVVGADAAGGDSPEEAAQRAAQAMVGQAVTRLAGERVPGGPDPQAVAAAIDVVPSQDSGVVSVTATDPTPGGARALANAVGESYLQLAAADSAERYARRIERLEVERESLQAQLADVWGTFGRRAASLRATAGPTSTVGPVIGSDPLLQQLRDNGDRLAERLSTVERSIVVAEASSDLAPIERQDLIRAGDPPSARGTMVRRSSGLAVPLGVLLGAGLAWRRVERDGTTSANPAPGFRFLGRLPAARARLDGTTDARTLGLWRQLRLVATARDLEDLVVYELSSPRRSTRAAQPLLEAARADGCVVREDQLGSRGRDAAATDDSRAPDAGPLRVVRATSTAVLSSVPAPRHTGVVVIGLPSVSFERDVRAVEVLVTAAGAEFLGVLVGAAARRRALLRLPLTHAGAERAPSATARSGGGTDAR